MLKQLIIVLCEGPHDVAFLVRILKCEGFESNENTKIGDFPSPMNSLLKEAAQKADVESLNLQEIRRVFLPSNTLKRNENYLFFYPVGGDGKKAERKKMLETLVSYIPAASGEISVLPADTQLALLYFFDADQKGIEARVTEINKEIEVVLPVHINFFTNHAETKSVNKILLGNYIFSKPSTGKGKLEDILMPLMSKGNELIFKNAQKFVHQMHDKRRLFKLKILKNNGSIVEKRSNEKFKFDRYKSRIGVAGQLQKSGGSNAVAISDTDYLTFEKIKSDPVCQEIALFFNKFC